jgi:hypothetical protein
LDNLGHITLLWEEWQSQQAFVSVSADGVSFSTPTRLQAGAACGLGPCTTDPGVYPQLSVTPKGVITVAFYGTVSTPRIDVFSARSVDGGATFTTVSVALFLVNGLINVAGPQEQEYLAWSSPNNAISFSASLDGGKTFGPVVTVADTFASDLYAVVDSGGNLDVLWRRGTASTGDSTNKLMFSRSADQGSTFSAPVAVLSTTEFVIPDYEHLVVDASGAIDITASADSQGGHEGNVVFARSTDNGATFSSTSLVADGGYPTSALDSCGGMNVAWDSGLSFGMNDILLARSIGGTFSPPANLSNNPASQTSFVPRIAADSRGNTFVVWKSSLAAGGTHAFFVVAAQHGMTCKQ